MDHSVKRGVLTDCRCEVRPDLGCDDFKNRKEEDNDRRIEGDI